MKYLPTFFLSILFICLGWQGIVYFAQPPDYILPGPGAVLYALYIQRSLILHHALPTLYETCIGLVIGILFGCVTSFAIVFFRPLARWFLPILILSQAIPTFAIAPLLVIWLGYGMASKIAVTALMIFFPVSSAFYDGLKRPSRILTTLSVTLNASKWRTFYHLTLPAALPSLASGIRIAAATAPLGAIVGEWVGSSQGLGYLMLTANARMQIDLMFATLAVIVMLVLALYFSIDKLLRVAIWW